jgi:glutamate-1-semialdehyde 2,1-aminomutase
MVPIAPKFLGAMREWTEDSGSLLVFDEVITYRASYGGVQELRDVEPDLTAMGKMIGGGFPVGAIAGRADVMDVMNPLSGKPLFPHSGTFSANPVTMTAGLTAMKLYDRDAVKRLNGLGERARRQIADAIRVAGVPACVTGAASMLRVHFKSEPPSNYRSSFATPREAEMLQALLDHLFADGFIMINTCSAMLSTVMTEREIDALCESMLNGLRKVKARFL